MITSFKEFINEAVINPMDTRYIISIIKSFDHIDSLDDINKVLKEYDIHFSFYDEFYNSLGDEGEQKVAPPKNAPAHSEIKFALFNKYLNKMHVVVVDDFIERFNEKRLTRNFYIDLPEMLKHESIHKQQVGKMGMSNYHLTDSPMNPKAYFSNKQEMMAYANSFVLDLTRRKYDKEKITNLLRNQKYIDSWIYQVYKRHVNQKDFQRFIKYVYLYLQEL